MYTLTHTHTCTLMRTHAQIHIHIAYTALCLVYVHIHIICIYIYIYIYSHIYTYSYILYIHLHIYMYIYIYIHIHICINIHTYRNIHTHTYRLALFSTTSVPSTGLVSNTSVRCPFFPFFRSLFCLMNFSTFASTLSHPQDSSQIPQYVVLFFFVFPLLYDNFMSHLHQLCPINRTRFKFLSALSNPPPYFFVPSFVESIFFLHFHPLYPIDRTRLKYPYTLSLILTELSCGLFLVHFNRIPLYVIF